MRDQLLPAFSAALFFLMCLLAPSGANAQAHRNLYPQLPWNDNYRPCWDEAARYHGVDPWLLYSIAKVESSYNPMAVNKANRNGSVDTGLMQINSVHWERLRRYGIEPSALHNACASTYIGAWVLADAQRRYGKTWKAVAAYNVGSLNNEARTRIGWRYASKVYATYDSLVKAQHR